MTWRSAVSVGAAVLGIAVVAGALDVVESHRDDRAADSVDASQLSSQLPSQLPAPDSGQKWVSWHGLAVLAPAAWGYGFEPNDQWCADNGSGDDTGTGTGSGTGHTPAPYVALDPLYGAQSEVGCHTPEHHDPAFGVAPESYWADHLTLQTPQGTDGTWHEDGWTVSTRTVDGVQIKVLSKDAAQSTAILNSARTVTIDAAGCQVSSPIQIIDHLRPAPFDVTTLDTVDAVSVCQYDRAITASKPGLIASHQMTGPTADDYLRALQTAPVGGGPDAPDDCSKTQTYGTGIVVRLWSGTISHDVYAYYDSCRDNGVDDGIHRRTLTDATCAPLFAQPPVTLWQAQSDVFSSCADTTQP